MGIEKKWLFTLFTVIFLSLILILLSCDISVFTTRKYFSMVQRDAQYHPTFAYYVFGGHREKDQIFRLLLAIYHPRNRYLLHLEKGAKDEERQQLLAMVSSVPVIQAFGNVDVVGKPDVMTYMGSTNVAIALRAAAIMLKLDSEWNWFINLSARDYPLITQDGMPICFLTGSSI